MKYIMSRRKQSNPKPLLKRDDEEEAAATAAASFGDGGEVHEASNRTTAIGDAESHSDAAMSVSPSLSATPPPRSPPTPTDSPAPPSSSVSSPSDFVERTVSHSNEPSRKRHSPPTVMSALPSPHVTTPETMASGGSVTTATAATATADGVDTVGVLTVATSKKTHPVLRLNTTLASDPALQPKAKDIQDLSIEQLESDGDCAEDVIAGHHAVASRREAAAMPHAVTSSSPKMEMGPRIPVFVCGPCNIRFSSLSTLEAHKTYYCSHRKDANEKNGGGGGAGGAGAGTGAGNGTSNKNTAAGGDANSNEPPAKALRTGKQYACSQCSYSADKKVSLNRHMRMHQTSPAPSSTTSNGDEAPSQTQQVDRYCSECDIRFSSTKTYRAHKQHYCSSRHREGLLNNSTTPKPNSSKGGSQSPPEIVKTPPAAMPQAYFALHTTPIVIVPYSLIMEANILPGPLTFPGPVVANPENTCFILQNNSLTPIAQRLPMPVSVNSVARGPTTPGHVASVLAATSMPALPMSAAKETNNHIASPPVQVAADVLKVANKKANSTRDAATTPLDLSVRRTPPESHRRRERSHSLSSNASAAEHALRMDIDKENVSVASGDSSLIPEQIVCAPSLPGSPPLTPSPKRREQSPRSSAMSGSPTTATATVTNTNPTMLMRSIIPTELAMRLSAADVKQHSLELALRLSATNTPANSANPSPPQPQQHPPLMPSAVTVSMQAQHVAASMHGVPDVRPLQPPPPPPPPSLSSASSSSVSNLPPQIFVKQGVSKCKECNIVFCKYENYLAHKKHYCSARNVDDGGDGTKTSPPVSPQSTSPSGPPPTAYQQLICAACGIKFTSLDNLSAHQMYYCPKRIETSTVTKERCSKCKTSHEVGQSCAVSGGGGGGGGGAGGAGGVHGAYKCPICEVVSANATESRRHMESHGGVKAFRCSICRYKGNTIRGMRTHIRMHFDKKTLDFNEENYITCILEDDGVEILPATQIQSQDTTQNMQLHYCEMCNYSSSYKGNVVRHVKLVHSHNAQSQSISPSLGEGGESLIHNGGARDDSLKSPAPEIAVAVKCEPRDSGGSGGGIGGSVGRNEHLSDNDKSSPVHIKNEYKEKMIVTGDHHQSHHYMNMNMNINMNMNVQQLHLSSSASVSASSSLSPTPPSPQQQQQPQQPHQPHQHQSAPPPQQTPPPPPLSHPQQQPPRRTTPVSSPDLNSSTTIGQDSLHSGQKYCKTCDIRFNYLNTYIAHKKFYCKSSVATVVRGGDAVATAASPPTVVQRTATEASAL